MKHLAELYLFTLGATSKDEPLFHASATYWMSDVSAVLPHDKEHETKSTNEEHASCPTTVTRDDWEWNESSQYLELGGRQGFPQYGLRTAWKALQPKVFQPSRLCSLRFFNLQGFSAWGFSTFKAFQPEVHCCDCYFHYYHFRLRQNWIKHMRI